MRTRSYIFQNIDWMLIVVYLLLVLMGWLNIYAVTFSPDHESFFDFDHSYTKQLVWILFGLVLMFGILTLDVRLYDTFAYFLYGGAILALLAVLVIGREINGARSWFVIGSLSIQPSEFAKFATALALTKFLTANSSRFQKLRTKIEAIAILGLPAAIIILQPDPGSTLVYFSFIFVLYREGLSGKVLLIGLGAAVFFILALLLKDTFILLPFDLQPSGTSIFILVLVTIAGLLAYVVKRTKNAWIPIAAVLLLSVGFILSVEYIFDNVLKEHHQNRINELLGIVDDPTGAGYNVHQSKIAIGSGGFSGKGFLQGTQTKNDFVPEQSTDFIFCTVGEEWGFLGTFVVIVLFMLLLFRLIWVAERQRSNFARIYGYCVASIFFFHVAINIGMTIGLAPVIGIPLPFFSYGGSSLWAFTILLFIFVKLDSERKYIL